VVDNNVFEVDVDAFESSRAAFGLGKCDVVGYGVNRLITPAFV
jgi:hypothetical protein